MIQLFNSVNSIRFINPDDKSSVQLTYISYIISNTRGNTNNRINTKATQWPRLLFKCYLKAEQSNSSSFHFQC